MLGLKLNHVSKRGHRSLVKSEGEEEFQIDNNGTSDTDMHDWYNNSKSAFWFSDSFTHKWLFGQRMINFCILVVGEYVDICLYFL